MGRKDHFGMPGMYFNAVFWVFAGMRTHLRCACWCMRMCRRWITVTTCQNTSPAQRIFGGAVER